jgi:hypothetical protein
MSAILSVAPSQGGDDAAAHRACAGELNRKQTWFAISGARAAKPPVARRKSRSSKQLHGTQWLVMLSACAGAGLLQYVGHYFRSWSYMQRIGSSVFRYKL